MRFVEVRVWGHNQHVISLADLQVHLNRWRGSANYRSSILVSRSLLVSQFPNFVGAQLRSSLIGGLGDLQALQNLNQLTELNLERCGNLTGQSVSEFVGVQLWSSLIGGAGDLQALQNLNQLTNLNLQCCPNITGAFR